MHVNNVINYAQPINWNSPLNRGLISWWMVLPRWRGGLTWRDLRGRNHGTLTNMAPATDWVVSTRRGGLGALDFDGVNDNVLASYTPAAIPLTLTAWGRTSSSSNQAHINLSSSSGTYAGLAITSLGIYSYINQSASGSIVANSTGTATSGAWTMAAAVFQSGSFAAYRDGANKGTAANGYSPSIPNVYIGSFNNSSAFFNGQLDCIRVYNRALSDAEIFALYLEDMLGNPTTLNRIRRTTSYFLQQSQNNIYIPSRKLIKTNTLIGIGSQFIG